jgi:hypothetical protein
MDQMAQPSTNEPTPVVFAQDTVNALRTVQQLTLTLSQMADQKASILMGATFVVFSISISRALDGHLPWSLAVLAVFSFLSALLAVLAVMPSVSRAGKGPAAADTNLFFFGHFAQMSEEEWIAAMFDRLSTDEGLHRTMLRDMYQNGQVLYRRKYRYLGYAYRAFVLGLVVTLASFVIELTVTG